MKRTIALLIALSMMLISLSACGVMTSTNNDSLKGSGSVSGTTDKDDNESGEVEGTKTATVSELVIYDEGGLKVTVKSLEQFGFMGPELKLLIENNSSVAYTFQARNTVVNGYMVDNIMSVSVAPGKKANDSLTFVRTDLDMCGIKEIAKISFNLHMFKTESMLESFTTDTITITTSIADGYTYTYDDSGKVIYDEGGIKIVAKGRSEDTIFAGITLYIENNSSSDVMVQTRDTSINGFMLTGAFSPTVTAGNRCIETVDFLDSELQENGIDQINSVELKLVIINPTNLSTIAESGTISLTFD